METDLSGAEPSLSDALADKDRSAGFVDAFDLLYRAAYQHAYQLLGDRQEAEDIAQEACARACLRWRRIDNPRAWVLRVTTNLVFDRFRRLRTAAKHTATRPAPAAPADERHLDLRRALARLPKRQRDVVALRYLADLSEAETAAALGCSRGTVKTHAARGLRALRASVDLADEGDAS